MRPPLLFGALFAVLLPSCYSAGDGQAPPLDHIYFPTGLTLDQPDGADGVGKRHFLFVASSDFDLQYRASALASYSLDAIDAVVPRSCNSDLDCGTTTARPVCDVAPSAENGGVPSFFCVPSAGSDPCGLLGQSSAADRLLYPGRCKSVSPEVQQADGSVILHDTVGIGAFATDIIFRAQSQDSAAKQRLFLPVRGDASLHWIDVGHDGRFSCGQDSSSDHSCDAAHRAGNDKTETPQNLTQPSEPFGVDATSDGRYVAVTNQTDGSVSLYFNDWTTGATLQHILSGLPQRPVAIAAVPQPSWLPNQEPAFLVAYRNAPQVDLLRVHQDLTGSSGTGAATAYARYVLNYAGTAGISVNSVGSDSRGIAIDGSDRERDYAACMASGGADGCKTQVHQPRVFVANRAPATLLVGGLLPNASYASGTSDLPAFNDSVSLTAGPSRVVIGQIRVPGNAFTDDNGQPYSLERRVFIVCFDSRRIFVYDPERRIIDSIISTGRGPYALAIDETHGLGYVAHFTDSYLGVISLDQRFRQSYASMIASVGTPSPPRTSK